MDLLGTDFPYSQEALKGKHALVCGASKGIGEATAKMMAKAGANVTVCARNVDSLNQLVTQLQSLGSGQHQALVMDLEDTENLASKVRSLVNTSGPVHILINNAGGPPGGPLMNNEVVDFEAHSSVISMLHIHLSKPLHRTWKRKVMEGLSKSYPLQ